VSHERFSQIHRKGREGSKGTDNFLFFAIMRPLRLSFFWLIAFYSSTQALRSSDFHRTSLHPNAIRRKHLRLPQ
jgi:hypothetical protein